MLSIGMTEWFSSVDQEFSLVDALWSLSSPLSVEREMRERTTPSAAKRRPLPPLLGKEGNLIILSQTPRTANEPKDITLSLHRIEAEGQCPEKFNERY